jgi:predicted helicase
VGSVLKRHQRTACQTVAVVDDPSDWFREHAEPRYILDLLTRVVTVSVGTVEIVESLSNLEFGPKEAPIP